jgi:hypothetical protein
MNQENPQVLRASGFALVLGSLIAIAAVLPAEYGVDPTGLGASLGLLQLSTPEARESTPDVSPVLTESGAVNRIMKMPDAAAR